MLGNGLILLLDGKLAAPLTARRLSSFLRHYPKLIRVHRITEPVVVEQDGGVGGSVVIAESHIAVHTRGLHATVDIRSCIGFETGPVIKAVVQLLGLTHHTAQTILRPMPPPVAFAQAVVTDSGPTGTVSWPPSLKEV